MMLGTELDCYSAHRRISLVIFDPLGRTLVLFSDIFDKLRELSKELPFHVKNVIKSLVFCRSFFMAFPESLSSLS